MTHTSIAVARLARTGLALAAAALLGIASAGAMAQAAPASPPAFVTRGLPAAGQQAMQALAGDWRVTMSLYIAGGTAEHPLTGTFAAHREWVGAGRFLREVITGEAPVLGAYWRMGMLGYSTMDQRFEWVTQDALNSGMMVYQGAMQAGPAFPASLTGVFTDPGVLGERFAGQPIRQRTVITVHDRDHHTFDIYFTPPGEAERLIDRKVFERVRVLQ